VREGRGEGAGAAGFGGRGGGVSAGQSVYPFSTEQVGRQLRNDASGNYCARIAMPPRRHRWPPEADSGNGSRNESHLINLIHTIPSSPFRPNSLSAKLPSGSFNTARPLLVVPSGNRHTGRVSRFLASASVLYNPPPDLPAGADAKERGKEPVRATSARRGTV
jgi:hypothetical protein